jgi:curved DNA-binding protein CbpA
MALSIARFYDIKNPYDVLGVLPTIMQMEIKQAYRTKAKKTHPDRHPLNEKDIWEKSFQEVHEAYEILSNPQTRKDYDEYLYARKAAGNVQYEDFWKKIGLDPSKIKSDVARKKWYDKIKLQNGHVTNFKKEWNLGIKKRIWIYALAGIVLTVGFSLGSCYLFGC